MFPLINKIHLFEFKNIAIDRLDEESKKIMLRSFNEIRLVEIKRKALIQCPLTFIANVHSTLVSYCSYHAFDDSFRVFGFS